MDKELVPYYPNPQGGGRWLIGLERMLCIYFMQHGYNLSDLVIKEALYDWRAICELRGIDLGNKVARPLRLAQA